MKKKMIAPIFITILLVLFLLGYFIICLMMPGGMVVKSIGLIVIASLIGTSIYVLVERIREIRSGEEDDLSKY